MAKKKMICRNCGSLAAPKTKTPGNFFIELVLWCCILLPGIIYSIWRHSSKHWVCRSCGSSEVIAPLSPAGKKLMMEFHNVQV